MARPYHPRADVHRPVGEVIPRAGELAEDLRFQFIREVVLTEALAGFAAHEQQEQLAEQIQQAVVVKLFSGQNITPFND